MTVELVHRCGTADCVVHGTSTKVDSYPGDESSDTSRLIEI